MLLCWFRTYVHERVYDEFIEKVKVCVMRAVVGDSFRKGVEQANTTVSTPLLSLPHLLPSAFHYGGAHSCVLFQNTNLAIYVARRVRVGSSKNNVPTLVQQHFLFYLGTSWK